MNGRFSLRDFGQTIHLEDVVRYLTEREWKMKRDEERGRIWFEGPEDDAGAPILQYLPASEEYADYLLRVEDLIAALTVIEERPAIEILTEMVSGAQRDGQSGQPANAIGVRFTESVPEIIEKSCVAARVISVDDARELVEELQPLLANAELAIEQQRVESPYVFEVKQQAALVVARIAKRLRPCGESKLLLWRVFEVMLAPIGLRVAWTPSQLDGFYVDAESADIDSPDELLKWIPGIARGGRRARPLDDGTVR